MRPERIATVINQTLRRTEEARIYHWYTATGAFTEARGACDHAVELARREDAIDLRPFKGGTATSRALSNRGVLRALSGDSTGAASDLRAAAKLKEAFPAAGSNLAHLESSPAYRVALASGNAD